MTLRAIHAATGTPSPRVSHSDDRMRGTPPTPL
jgi:hypothetical protein